MDNTQLIIDLGNKLKPLLSTYTRADNIHIKRLVGNNYSLIEKLAVKIDVQIDGCWNWIGSSSVGYGTIGLKGKTFRSHRVVWEYFNGQIPNGLELDHLCRNKICCNPDHLETVTHQENIKRAKSLITYCPQGHELSGDNIYSSQSIRICKKCNYINMKTSRSKRMANDPEYKAKISEENRVRAREYGAKKRDELRPNRIRRVHTKYLLK